MKEMGIGLAAAVLIDATIVRGVLLPATMKLLGDWNWYLPNWLEWLPQPRARAVGRGVHRPGCGRPAGGRLAAPPIRRPASAARGPGGRTPPTRGRHNRTEIHVTNDPRAASDSVCLSSVTKVYGNGTNQVVALRELSLSLARGSFTAVMGPVRIGEEHVSALRRRTRSSHLGVGAPR